LAQTQLQWLVFPVQVSFVPVFLKIHLFLFSQSPVFFLRDPFSLFPHLSFSVLLQAFYLLPLHEQVQLLLLAVQGKFGILLGTSALFLV